MSVLNMCTTAAGDVAIRMWGSGEVRVCGRKGRTHSTYTGLCGCEYSGKYISELIPVQYMAELCWDCNEIKVVDMVTHEVHKAYSGSSLSEELGAMCSGPGEGSLLFWDYKSQAVIELQWDEGKKQLKEVRRVQTPSYDTVYHMCYMSHADLLIMSSGQEVQGVKLQGGAGQPPVWQLWWEVLGKKIHPRGISSDAEGRVYVADCDNSRVLVVNGNTGEVMQELLLYARLGWVTKVCCLSNPNQLLVYHRPPPYYNTPTLSLYNITSL